ncbi:MAG: hypothetical protein NVS2B12_29110 [Ktedonobacteraceae bacterium]
MQSGDIDHHHTEQGPDTSWQALGACVTNAGIMSMQEFTDALASWRGERDMLSSTPPPYILTAQPGKTPTAALRWDWDGRRAHDFAAWCVLCLRERFAVQWSITYEDDDARMAHTGPRYLRLELDGQQERCDWRYLNQSHWMGAFCTIADRLLNPGGLTAVSLETGWFDTVIVFCRKSHAAELLDWFPEAE